MLRMDWLENQMHHCDTMAERLYRQFSYEYVGQSLAQWQQEFAAGQADGTWKSLIVTEGDQLLGGAALARDDLSSRPDLGPWLACVLVAPEARGQGLAERLIEGICNHARAMGNTSLYLHTHDKSDYYAKRGWSVLEPFEAWGKEQWLMSREL
ncbi:GNAT family N-acetyltransferase [Pseudomonas segetis]|uniref:Acetyltransferase (GNAT) domain-containing protein n=1 Tax=Pseudomonas segetis TaxID=298908 RepID=A0A239CFK4_9PSED|nr:GNAT family N-acetyltransferase [Pseudomonas segetis]SNS18244.1 Acetyltransferase (GNAT) domain-containing protein [Pseudomonas segetis]